MLSRLFSSFTIQTDANPKDSGDEVTGKADSQGETQDETPNEEVEDEGAKDEGAQEEEEEEPEDVGIYFCVERWLPSTDGCHLMRLDSSADSDRM